MDRATPLQTNGVVERETASPLGCKALSFQGCRYGHILSVIFCVPRQAGARQCPVYQGSNIFYPSPSKTRCPDKIKTILLLICDGSTKKNTLRKRYPSDFTDAQWNRIEPLIPPAKPGGRNYH